MKFEVDIDVFNHEYVQQPSSKDIILKLDEILTLLRSNTMITVQDVLNAVTAEQSQVADAVNALTQQVQDLQSVLVTGSQVTQADLQNIITSVGAIFTLPAVGGVGGGGTGTGVDAGGGGVVGGNVGGTDVGGAVPADPVPVV